MNVLTLKTPLEERVANFLQFRPDAEYIPLHPEDYFYLQFEGNLGKFDRPVKMLGRIGHRKNQEESENG